MTGFAYDGHTPFYTTGGTLPLGAPSYVVRQADEDLLDALCRGQYCYVLTPRQMGKSSLMVRTAARLREDGFAVVVVDLNAIGHDVEKEAWYYSLTMQMGRRLGMRQELGVLWQEHEGIPPLQKWLLALVHLLERRAPERLVLFVDEIDQVRTLPFPTDEFFAAIRSCFNRRSEEPVLQRLTFCLLGTATPFDLIQDMRLTPFNIGRRIELCDFTKEEVRPLAEGLGRSHAGALLRRVYHWTNGHPYLTQSLCAEIAADASARSPKHVDALAGHVFLDANARERNMNLADVANRLLGGTAEGESEEHRAAILDLYAKVLHRRRVVDDEADRLVALLKLSGITRTVDGCLRVRNRVYERVLDGAWIRANLPDAEARRHNAAYRRGVARAAGVSAVVVAAIALLALTAVRQSLEARKALREAVAQRTRANRQTAEAVAQRTRADERAAAELAQRLRADAARREAGLQRSAAERERDAGRRVLCRSRIDRGVSMVEQGDPLSALQQFAEAARLDDSGCVRGGLARLHYGMALRQSPRLLHVFPAGAATFDPAGRRVLGMCGAMAWQRDLASGRMRTARFPEPLLAVSPDGRYVATRRGGVRVRDWATGHMVGTPLRQMEQITAAAFSPNGMLLVTMTATGHAQVWRVGGPAARAPLLSDDGGAMQLPTFSHDGCLVVYPGRRAYSVWDTRTGQRIASVTHNSTRSGCAGFIPGGPWFVAIDADGVGVWHALTGKRLMTLPFDTTAGALIGLSRDGRHLAVASRTWTQVYRMWSPAAVRSIKAQSYVNSAVFSNDGRYLLISTADRTSQMWDIASGERVGAVIPDSAGASLDSTGHCILTVDGTRAARLWDIAQVSSNCRPLVADGIAQHAEFSPDGRNVVSVSGEYRAGEVRVWDASSGKTLRSFWHPEGACAMMKWSPDGRRAAFSPEGRRLATVGGNVVRLWDLATGKLLAVFRHVGRAHHVEFSPDGRRLLTTFGLNHRETVTGQTARVWDIGARRVALSVRHGAGTAMARYSPDGRRILTTSGDPDAPGEARVWDAATGMPVGPRMPHRAIIFTASFSPDGRRVVTGSKDGTIALWNARTARRIWIVMVGEMVRSAVFSQDGRRVVTGGFSGTARVWNAEDGQPVTPELKHAGPVRAVAFSPDGSMVAAVSDPGSARLWDARTGNPIGPPLGRMLECGSHPRASFSSDGRWLLISGHDPVVRLWDLTHDPMSYDDQSRLARILAPDPTRLGVDTPPTQALRGRRAWEAARNRYLAACASGTAAGAAWELEEGLNSIRAGRPGSAIPHLDEAIRARPADGALYGMRAYASALLGEWSRAAADYAQVNRLGTVSPESWASRAFACLAAGDMASYRNVCDAGLRRFAGWTDPHAAAEIVGACVAVPGAVRDPQRIVHMARRAAAGDPGDPAVRAALGMALFRAGDCARAVKLLESTYSEPRRAPREWLFLGMAHRAIGDAAGGRRCLARAVLGPRDEWTDSVSLPLLRREAEALIGTGP